MVNNFSISRIPRIIFGPGSIDKLPSVMSEFGDTFLVITGGSSFESGHTGSVFFKKLADTGMTIYRSIITREPSPADVDKIVSEHLNKKADAVVGIGGGSVLDTAKAVSAMLKVREPVKDFMEGVGTKSHPGTKIPYIAVPTTAGTGSETTENAVLSEIGRNGFKRSLRHPSFMPDIALVDPGLTLSCPPAITAAGGMDALTQLLEAFMSVKANTFTDSLAPEAIRLIVSNLPLAFKNGNDLNARTTLAYSAMVSGILLANAGLGLVHGFASSVGGLIEIPHGVLCGTLIGAANRAIYHSLLSEDKNSRYMKKYTMLGSLVNPFENFTDEEAALFFISKLEQMVEDFNLPRIGRFGLNDEMVDKAVALTGQKNNPVILGKHELVNILKSRL